MPKGRSKTIRVLVIDVGGSNVKLRSSANHQTAKFTSGKAMTAEKMVKQARSLTASWDYDLVSIGFPGLVIHGKQPWTRKTSAGSGFALISRKSSANRSN
jgi:hypothetical protein